MGNKSVKAQRTETPQQTLYLLIIFYNPYTLRMGLL